MVMLFGWQKAMLTSKVKKLWEKVLVEGQTVDEMGQNKVRPK